MHIVIGSSAVAVTCTVNVPPTNPDNVYRIETINGTEVVQDLRNGLMWKRDPEPREYTFDNAVSHAARATYGGFSDWRLPELDELESLVEKCRTKPALNNTIFRGDGVGSVVWSGSSSALSSDGAWYVGLSDGNANDYYGRSGAFQVRLARGGQLFDFLSEGQRVALSAALKSHVFHWRMTDAKSYRSVVGEATTTDLQARLQRALTRAYVTGRAPVPTMPDQPSVEPREADFERPLTFRERGEFETTTAYEARKRDAQAAHEESVKQAHAAAMQAYQAAQRTYQQNVAREQQASAALEAPAGWVPLLEEAWKDVVAKHLGAPTLTDVSYDADKQAFNATLRSSIGTYSKTVVAPAPLDRAPAMKPNLVSGKIAPAVTLRFPGPEVTWELAENDALRRQRFSDADNSVSLLESLIAEYPASAEAKLARMRIFQVPNTSKELIAVTSRLSSWPEVSTGRARLREVQMADWKAAEAINLSTAYKNFIDNFARVDSQGLF